MRRTPRRVTDRIALVLGLLLAVTTSPTTAQSRDDGVVQGEVRDLSGAVIPGVVVTSTCGERSRSTRSDGLGRFEIRALPSRACVIAAESTLFAPARVAVDLSGGDVPEVRLVLSVPEFETGLVVTPSAGDREPTFGVPELVTVTNRRAIATRPHHLLPQVLRDEPGVLVQQTTAAHASPFIRGSTGQRLIYLVDGVRFNTSIARTGPSRYLGWISPAFTDRLEVVRGPASVQYGSGALGGAVQVLGRQATLSPAGTEVGGGVSGLLGSSDVSGGGAVQVSVATSRVAVLVGAAGRRIDDVRAGRGRDSRATVTRFLGLPSSVVGTRLQDTGFTQRGGYLAARFRAGASGLVTASYRYDEQFGVSRYDRVQGGPGAPGASSRRSGSTSPSFDTTAGPRARSTA